MHMAWIAGLADKAENILNKLDQNAATALQVTATDSSSHSSSASSVINTAFQQNVPSTLSESMKKSLSSGSLSLKTSLSSPAKLSKLRFGGSAGGGSGNSVKNEDVIPTGMTDSIESGSKVEWQVNSEKGSSRRSSISAKADAVAIEMGSNANIIDMERLANDNYSSVGVNDNQELAAFKIALTEVTSERDELRLRLNALNRDIENAGLKQRLQELEILAQRLQEERDQVQSDLLESQAASSAYIHSISELESNLAKLQQEYFDVAQKLQMQMKETAQQRQDLQEYRTKAQRALQMKDNLIAELKASGSSGFSGTTANEENNELRLLQIELNGLRQEHQHVREENANLLQHLEEARSDLNELSKRHADMIQSLRANEETLRKETRLEKERTLQLESEQRVLTQELVTLRQQLSNQMAASATRLQEKERLIEQLKAGYSGRSGAHTEFNGAGTRIKSLTQALVDKQNAVEHVTAERNALRIQLEKVQDQLQQSIYQSHSSSSSTGGAQRNILLLNSTDDAKAQFPLLMKENPFDNRVARRVKRAYSSLDSAGIRLGAFLRRYPLMRIFVLMYVALLHIWVMFVLLSSTPT